MANPTLTPVHPGEVLLEEFLEPMGIRLGDRLEAEVLQRAG